MTTKNPFDGVVKALGYADVIDALRQNLHQFSKKEQQEIRSLIPKYRRIVEAEERGNDYFEKGDPRLVGETVMNYGENSFRHTFKIRGRRGNFPRLVN